jgi:hypothetical protein
MYWAIRRERQRGRRYKEGASEEATQEEAKQVFLSKEDEDEREPIEKLIRKQEVIIDPREKGKTKE